MVTEQAARPRKCLEERNSSSLDQSTRVGNFTLFLNRVWKNLNTLPSISSIARFWRMHVGEELELGPETGPFQ